MKKPLMSYQVNITPFSPEPQSKKDKENVVQITRINDDHVPPSAKYIDSCKQLSKQKFPRDYWERRSGCW
eukprot:12049847-Karenia_brevis.AAC.1